MNKCRLLVLLASLTQQCIVELTTFLKFNFKVYGSSTLFKRIYVSTSTRRYFNRLHSSKNFDSSITKDGSRQFVGWLAVPSFVSLVVISRQVKSISSVFIEIWRSVPVPNFTFDFREVKVKAQGHHFRIENVPILIVRPWFKISLPKSAIRQISSYRK